MLAIGAFISTTTKNQIIAGAATFSVCLLLWVLSWVSFLQRSALGAGRRLLFHPDALRAVLEGHHRYQRYCVLHFRHFPGIVSDFPIA